MLVLATIRYLPLLIWFFANNARTMIVPLKQALDYKPFLNTKCKAEVYNLIIFSKYIGRKNTNRRLQWHIYMGSIFASFFGNLTTYNAILPTIKHFQASIQLQILYWHT